MEHWSQHSFEMYTCDIKFLDEHFIPSPPPPSKYYCFYFVKKCIVMAKKKRNKYHVQSGAKRQKSFVSTKLFEIVDFCTKRMSWWNDAVNRCYIRSITEKKESSRKEIAKSLVKIKMLTSLRYYGNIKNENSTFDFAYRKEDSYAHIYIFWVF